MMFSFVSGLITAGFGIAGLFFLRYWQRSRDKLFLAFAAAFWLLALNQALLVVSGVAAEDQSWFYLLRLAAFVLIILGIWLKNRRRP
jgi:peptidoglycan/LPS O-acetylase OafA/YrhL